MHNPLKKCFLIFLFFFFLSPFCYSQDLSVTHLTGEENHAINENQTEINIRCNIQKANVYINGQYQGKTELKIKNLREGTYSLKITRKGFMEQQFEITVEKGLCKNFYIELQEELKDKAD